MKTLLLLLLICSVFISYAQENRHVPHCIFFQKPGDDHLRKISEGDNCIIGLKQNRKRYQEDIRRISFDTVFLNDTVLKIKDISYFCFKDELKSPILLSKASDMPTEYILFSKDTLVWKVRIPPATIFSSGWEYHRYVSYHQDSAKISKKHHITRKPFQDRRRPGQK